MPHHATPADLPTAAMLLIDNCGNKDVTIPPDDLEKAELFRTRASYP
jgi:hypothetical protein